MSYSKDSETGELGGNLEMTLPLLPLRDILVFPSTVVPLFVGREKSIQALEQAMNTDKKIFLAAQKKAKKNDPDKDEIFEVGTISNILQLLRLPDGTVKVLVEGERRAKIQEFVQTEEYFLVKASYLKEAEIDELENAALIRTVKMAFDNYVRLNKRTPPEMLITIAQIEDEAKLADTLVAHLGNLKLGDKQELLEITSPHKRLEKIYSFIQAEIEIMRVEKKIKARVKRQMEKTQKEYYLNEQIAAIQKELGEKDDSKAEIDELERRLNDKKMPEEAYEKIKKEIKKLRSMSPMSAEATVVRNYVDIVLTLPWQKYSEDIRDLVYAESILNRDHFGLEKVKERILEYLSIKSIVNNMKGPILCLVGPPGVGKTSLARSVSEAVGRKFVRIALGGVKDQAEIRGHRKTYIGSLPGKIIMSIKKAGTSNPVVLLDEIDKLSNDYRGDPASALLEVLDPEQNNTFNDHYLDLDYDLSKCLFIATANTIDGIPAPLLDRTELIKIAGYTEIEKVEIAKKFLVPKQMKENGLEDQQINFERNSIIELIRYYTKEAGVRNLEREIASVLRKVTRSYLKNASNQKQKASKAKKGKSKAQYIHLKKDDLAINKVITPKVINKSLGVQRYRISTQNKQAEIGVCTGMAWTAFGGELLITEVAILPGKGKLLITGKLGDVMQESAQAALSYVRSRSKFIGLKDDFYQNIDIHIHVPEGAIPKDGPSAGLCMATALTSALTKKHINPDVSMTGEITLSGRSLPIGGLKEKSIAAHRGQIKKIIFPYDNIKDLEEIPKNILKDVEFVPVKHMDEVLIHAIAWQSDNLKKNKDPLFLKLLKSVDNDHKDSKLPSAI